MNGIIKLCEIDCVLTSCKNLTSVNLNYNFSQTVLSITNFAIFSLKMFQQKSTIFTKCNFFGQIFVSWPLRKPDE